MTLQQTINDRRFQVWAAITAEPRITRTAIAQEMGINRLTVRADLEALRRMGYIDWTRYATGFRVLVRAGTIGEG